nr:MAG TPA: hypothetical protein [Caudoviricetes sp.]
MEQESPQSRFDHKNQIRIIFFWQYGKGEGSQIKERSSQNSNPSPREPQP